MTISENRMRQGRYTEFMTLPRTHRAPDTQPPTGNQPSVIVIIVIIAAARKVEETVGIDGHLRFAVPIAG